MTAAQPKGGMCVACTKSGNDCSGKDFASMPTIKVYPDGVKAVKCVDFDHAKPVAPRNAITFREGLAHAASYFQDISGAAFARNAQDILSNIEKQAANHPGDFGDGMLRFIQRAQKVLSDANAVASTDTPR